MMNEIDELKQQIESLRAENLLLQQRIDDLLQEIGYSESVVYRSYSQCYNLIVSLQARLGVNPQ